MENCLHLINIKSQSQNDKAKALQESYSDDLSDDISNELLKFATFTADKNKLIVGMFSMLKN